MIVNLKKGEVIGNLKKPNYSWDITLGRVKVEASTAKPVYFKFNSAIEKVTSTLYANPNVSGVGGLRTGLTLAANTPYYLYAVYTTGVYLLLDENDPDTGPSGYDLWTYIGGASTADSEATFVSFISSNGRMAISRGSSLYQHSTTSSSLEEKTTLAPVTARIGFFQMYLSGTISGSPLGAVSADGTNSWTICEAETSGDNDRNCFSIPFLTPRTVWIKNDNAVVSVNIYLIGWQEDPSEWQ